MVLPQPPLPVESGEGWTGNTSIPQWNFFGTDKFDVFHLRALLYLVTPKEVANLTGPNHNLSYAEEAHHVQDVFSDVSCLSMSDISTMVSSTCSCILFL